MLKREMQKDPVSGKMVPKKPKPENDPDVIKRQLADLRADFDRDKFEPVKAKKIQDRYRFLSYRLWELVGENAPPIYAVP